MLSPEHTIIEQLVRNNRQHKGLAVSSTVGVFQEYCGNSVDYTLSCVNFISFYSDILLSVWWNITHTCTERHTQLKGKH